MCWLNRIGAFTGIALLVAMPVRSSKPIAGFVEHMQQSGSKSPAQSKHPSGTANTSQPSSERNSLDTSDDQQATGTVIESNCASGLQLQLKTSSGTLLLYAPPGSHPRIVTPSGQSVGSAPCKSLQGQRVTARYKLNSAPAKSDDATIDALQILSSDENNSSVGPQAQPSIPDAASATGDNILIHGLAGDETTAEGKVSEVTCKGNDMLIKVAVANGVVTLHARDYTRLGYDDDRTSFEKKDFPACTDLKGRFAEVTFIVVEHRPYDGEIQHVEIEK